MDSKYIFPFPEEILIKIIDNLEPVDLLSFCQVNKQTRNLHNDQLFWKKKYYQYFDDIEPQRNDWCESFIKSFIDHIVFIIMFENNTLIRHILYKKKCDIAIMIKNMVNTDDYVICCVDNNNNLVNGFYSNNFKLFTKKISKYGITSRKVDDIHYRLSQIGINSKTIFNHDENSRHSFIKKIYIVTGEYLINNTHTKNTMNKCITQ